MDNLTLIVNASLNCKPEWEEKQEEQEDNGSPKIMDSEKETMKKKNKYAKKRKTQLASFCTKVKHLPHLESILSYPPAKPHF